MTTGKYLLVAALLLCLPAAADDYAEKVRAFYQQKLYDATVLDLKILKRWQSTPWAARDLYDNSSYPLEVRAKNLSELRNLDLSPSDLKLVNSGKKLTQAELDKLACTYLAGKYWCWRDELRIRDRTDLRKGLPKPVQRDFDSLNGRLYRMRVGGRLTYLIRLTNAGDNSAMLIYDNNGKELGAALCHIELCAWVTRSRALSGVGGGRPKEFEGVQTIWPDPRKR